MDDTDEHVNGPTDADAGTSAAASAPAGVNLAAALAGFGEQWAPRSVTRINDYEVKIAKVQGEFVWHAHEDTDEFFLVISGRLTLQLRSGDVVLGPGEVFTVPRGVEHCPRAEEETAILLMEPVGTVNTGSAGGPRTKAPVPLD